MNEEDKNAGKVGLSKNKKIIKIIKWQKRLKVSFLHKNETIWDESYNQYNYNQYNYIKYNKVFII